MLGPHDRMMKMVTVMLGPHDRVIKMVTVIDVEASRYGGNDGDSDVGASR